MYNNKERKKRSMNERPSSLLQVQSTHFPSPLASRPRRYADNQMLRLEIEKAGGNDTSDATKHTYRSLVNESSEKGPLQRSFSFVLNQLPILPTAPCGLFPRPPPPTLCPKGEARICDGMHECADSRPPPSNSNHRHHCRPISR